MWSLQSVKCTSMIECINGRKGKGEETPWPYSFPHTHAYMHTHTHTHTRKAFGSHLVVIPNQWTSTGIPVHHSGAIRVSARLVTCRRLYYASQMKVWAPMVPLGLYVRHVQLLSQFMPGIHWCYSCVGRGCFPSLRFSDSVVNDYHKAVTSSKL